MCNTYLPLCIALAVPVTVSAESAPPADEEMERIIVTGSRIVESIDEVPASITIVTAEQLQNDLQVSSELQNMLAIRVPGMAPSTGSTSNFGQTLRGRAALVMIDGVPQSTPLRNGGLGIRTLDPSVIERIEVIKGATSVYGNGAAGGIINYITKKPGRETGVRLGVSSRASLVKMEDSLGHRLEAVADGSLDDLSYVLSAVREENGVQRDAEGDIIGTKYGISDSVAHNYFTKLGYQLDDDKLLQLTYNYYESQMDADLVDVLGDINAGEKTYAVKNSSGTPNPGEPQGPRGNHNVMLRYNDLELFTNTEMTLDGYWQRIENVFFYSPVLSNPEQGYDGGQSYIKSEKSGFRATFNTQLEWDRVEGTFIYGTDLLNDVTSQPLVDGRIWVPEMDMNNLALFLQTKWIIADDWVVKAGVRHENIDLDVDDYQTLKLCRSADQCSVPMNVTGGKLEYRATTYNLGLRYLGDERFSPFANYSQGADISDIGRLLRTATVTDINDIRTEASIIDNYELGFSSQFDNLRFNVTAYRSTSELGTANKFDPNTGVYMPVRAPQKIWGYEASVDYSVSSDLALGGTYSWVEGKDTDNDIYLGARQIAAPKLTAYLDWVPVDNAKLSLTYLHVGSRDRFEPVEGNYVGDQAPVDRYDVVNLSARYQLENWELFAGIENLFNEDYYPATSQAFTYGGYNTKGLGSTLNLGAKVRF
ncbi:TonB-dependent receptor [Ferrimonas sediminicola]|uniref:TonB-dependent receptor n=1 Tax=Ferrimonas sediminicola TaxID=2569538 RepID=A0A4U1BEW0_9GAMM|nr:TonB-dependent receptor [Ferrimonas sediminicola]TKB48880.1 TonB-dependent receptor [Ferrimonas sediminicola]